MIGHTPVYKIMTKKPTVVHPEDSMEAIWHLFEQKGFHHAPVVRDRKLVGIISHTDYLRVIQDVFSNNDHVKAFNTQLLRNVLVQDIMSKEVITVEEHTTIQQVVAVFHTHPIHAVPVVDASFHLVGIVTTNDLLGVMEHLFLMEKNR